MDNSKNIVLAETPRNEVLTTNWQLDRDLVIKAAEEVATKKSMGRKSEDYFDDKILKKGVWDALCDENFPQYYEAYKNLDKFKDAHPEMINAFESAVPSMDEISKVAERFKNEPYYQDYLDLNQKESIAMLNLKTTNVSARILDVAIAYTDLSNIIFPEVTERN